MYKCVGMISFQFLFGEFCWLGGDGKIKNEKNHNTILYYRIFIVLLTFIIIIPNESMVWYGTVYLWYAIFILKSHNYSCESIQTDGTESPITTS